MTNAVARRFGFRHLRVLVCLALVAGWLAVAGTAHAADSPLVIRSVDTREFPKVKVLASYLGDPPIDATTLNLRENDRFVNDARAVPAASAEHPVGVVLTVDVDGDMRQKSRMDEVKRALRQFVATKGANDQIAIVAFSNAFSVVQAFTSDADRLNTAIDGMVAGGGAALFDGIDGAVNLFASRPDLQPNVVVISGSADTASQISEEQARGSAVTAKVSTFVVGLTSGTTYDKAALQRLTEKTSGLYQETDQPTQLTDLLAKVGRSLANQFEITYTSTAKGAFDLLLTTSGNGGASASAADIQGGTVAEGSSVNPDVVKVTGKPSLLQGDSSKWIVLALVIVAVGGLAFAIVPLLMKDESTLASVMRPYDQEAAPEEAKADQGMAQTAFLQRAVAMTGRIAEERGFLETTERKLEQADLKFRPAEALFFWLAATVVVTLLVFVLSGYKPILTLLGLLGGALIPPAVVVYLADKRRRAFTSLLPDALTLLSGTLRAGYSLQQGMETICQEVEEPMRAELRRVMIESSLGRPVEQALEDCAKRMASADFDWAVMAIRIQREVGGNLSELLDTVADTMLQRERLRREVRALTAEGKISAIVIGILPVALGIAMYAINPGYMKPLFNETIGQIMLGGSIVWACIGFFWMWKTIQVEV